MTKKEFEQLQSGQIIQSKKDPKWTFIVHQNFSDHLIAVRTIEVRDPEEWEVVEVKQEKVPFHEQPEIKAAAHELHEKIKHYDWYNMVGIGANGFIVYTKKKKHPQLFTSFSGINVSYKFMGKMAPLGGV